MTMSSSSRRTHNQMEEIAVVLKKFGDDHSTLLDRFERLSFEVQLNRAILGRSLSEPTASRSHVLPERDEAVVLRRRFGTGSGLKKVLKKFLKPILGRRKKKGAETEVIDSKICNERNPIPLYSAAFSRSLRV